jgi:hypothetical protein
MHHPSTITSAYIFYVKVRSSNDFIDTYVIASEIADIFYRMKDIVEIKRLYNICVYGTLNGSAADVWKSSNNDYIAFTDKSYINPSPDEGASWMVVGNNIATIRPRQYDWDRD